MNYTLNKLIRQIINCCLLFIDSVQMKSCLASLEALEVEIVPAFNSLLKDCSELNRNLSFLLKNYWIHQANALKNLIYLIIDPYAFAKVSYILQLLQRICTNSIDFFR